MTRPLRRTHRLVWAILAILLHALFVAGLMVRTPTTPLNPNLEWEQYP